jgi:hypothetical protein
MNASFDPTEIDRLVDGELDPPARGDLLRRLDAAPDGWRCCALAFLESQEFGGAARAWAREHSAATATAVVEPRRSPLPSRLAMAATLVGLAFLAGFATRGWATGPVERAGDSPRLIADSRGDTPKEADIVSAPLDIPAVAPGPPAMPEYVQAQWARAGYDVKPSRRVISVEEGGRKATFPVDSYHFEFVGRPTY